MDTPATAAEILSAMAGTYHRCRSYRDVGTVTTHVFPDNRSGYTIEMRFSTAFARPDRFRFEYREPYPGGEVGPRRVAWSSGDNVRDWVDWGNGERELHAAPSLRELMVRLGGVSKRVSLIVPSLLIPGWADGKRWRLHELTRLDDSRIGDADCYRVRGHFPVTPGHNELCQQEVRETLGEEVTWNPQTEPTVFWIEKERLLLRRFADAGRVANFRFESVADYQPELDTALTDAELAFGVSG